MKESSKIDPYGQKLEKLREIGSLLHKTRREQGISLEIIAEKTKIQLRLLKAIEEANLDILPESIYIQALIKQFANFLGLDGREVASSFPVESNLTVAKGFYGLTLPNFHLPPISLYLLYILLVIICVKSLANLLESKSVSVNSSSSTVSEAVQPQTQKSQVSQKPTPPATPSPAKPPENEVVVKVKIKNPSWMRVVVDGKTKYEGILPQGSDRIWRAKKQITIRAGNAGGVWLAVGDAEAKQLGASGQIKQVTYKVSQ